MTVSRPSGTQITNARELSDLVSAYWGSRAAITAMELDLFTALADGPLTAAELAARTNADPRAIELLANAIVGLGLLEKTEGRFTLSDFGASHLVRGQGDYLGGLMEHHILVSAGWSRLTDVVRQGKPARQLGPPGPPSDPPGGFTPSFIWAMHTMGSVRAGQLADALNLSGVERVADIGGGPGDNAYAILRRLPDATAVIFDLPEVVPLAMEIAAAEGVANRVEGQVGDYVQDGLPTNVDLVLLSHIIHSNDIPTCEMLMRKAFESLKPGGQCAVHDFVLDDDAAGPEWPALFALNMLTATPAGRSYTEAEIRGWLAEAGFTDIERCDVDPNVTAAVVGRKPLD